MRAYDITKKVQDLRYLDFEERTTCSGLSGKRLKAREGTGPGAVYYKLPPYDEARRSFASVCANELLAARLARIIGVPCCICQLVHAQVQVQGETHCTWVMRSKGYRRQGERSLPMDQFYAAFRHEGELPIELVERYGMGAQVAKMLSFDFLIANKARNGSNIEAVADTQGNFRLAPLFANEHSFAASASIGTAANRIVEPLLDIDADNFFGTRSLEENLELVSREVEIDPLRPNDREKLLLGLSGIVGQDELKLSWLVLWRRWERYAQLRDL